MDASASMTTAAAVLPVTARVPFGTKDALKQLKPLFTAEQTRARALSRTQEKARCVESGVISRMRLVLPGAPSSIWPRRQGS